MRWWAVVLLLVLVSCSRRETAREETEPARSESSSRREERREGAAIIKLIQESQREGIGGQDIAAFMRIFTEDARLILGRGERPDHFDEVIAVARIEAYRKRRKRDEGQNLVLSYKREKAIVKGDQADVTWDTTLEDVFEGVKTVQVERESWRLRRTAEGWRVYENRVWSVSRQRGAEERVVFDAAHWQTLDEAVEVARKSHAIHDLLPALYQAHRYGEGHDAAVTATKTDPSEQAWFWRAAFAMKLYFYDDAVTSFGRQLEINPDAEIPPWMPRPTQTEPAAPDAGL